MMTFFDYSEKVMPVDEFGIRDDLKGKEELKSRQLSENPESQIIEIPVGELPAFIDYVSKQDWNAVIESYGRADLNFIAVDNNIPYYDKNGNEKNRCDAMLWTDKTVVFIELKDKSKDWLEDAIVQLKSTIEFFDKVDGLGKFKYKKAYACNKMHPCFNYQFKDRIQQFFRDTRVSLHTEMVIKNIK